MPEKFDCTYTRDDGATEVTVELVVDDWGSAPSGLSGPPENYDPGSGMEVYINKAWNEETGEPVELTDAERSRMEEAFCADPPEADYPDYDDRD